MATPRAQKNNTINGFSKIIGASLLTAVALTSPALHAAQSQDVSQIKVAYEDLNLNSKEGQKKLSYRIKAAAKSVCGDNSRVPLKQRMKINACVKQSMSSAHKKFDTILAKRNIKPRFAVSESFAVGN